MGKGDTTPRGPLTLLKLSKEGADRFQLKEGVGGLGIFMGGRLFLPGEGSEEDDEEGDTEGGGVSC